ncbi:MAG: 6-pyruvoyl trahydropterin synthase family protein [Candidatus Asgardarchaeia archaeon]
MEDFKKRVQKLAKRYRFLRGYKTYFSAAHKLGKEGEYEPLHGHTYHIVVKVEMNDWLDFRDLKKVVDEKIRELDHHNLGDITAEEIAIQILDFVYNKFKRFSEFTWAEVEVWETPKYFVKVSKRNKEIK